jgi:transcriptional regulator with XRE-family HTH domain
MIKKYRKIHNLTQEKLAELLDISPRQLQKIESGHTETSLKTLKKLIKILDISDEDIVNYKKNKLPVIDNLFFYILFHIINNSCSI